MIKGIIFDVDGTLLDSMSVWDNVGELYLRELGLEPKEGLKETFNKLSLYQVACYYRSEYGVKLPVEEIMSGINALVERFYFEEAMPKPGVKAFLKDCMGKGIRMCVATATDRYLVDAALTRCGMREYFSALITCTEVGHGKDEPVIFREAVKCLGTDRMQTAVFEDALYALRTAKSDGFHTVGIYDIYEPEQNELRSLADVYLNDYSDMNAFWHFADK